MTTFVLDDFERSMRDLPMEARTLAPIFRERVARDAGRRFLTMGARTWTYGEFGADVLRFARGLARLGVGPDTIVPFLLPNCPEFVIAWFAVQLRGAAFAPVNPELKGRMLQTALDDCRAEIVIAGAAQVAHLETVEPACRARVRTVIAVGEPTPAGSMSFARVSVDGDDDPIGPATFDRIQAIMFTSGSTGPAKGVMMPNGHFFANPCAFIRISGLTRDDVLHTSLPLFHGVASRQGVMPAFMVGAAVHLGERFSASRLWQTVTEAGATVALLTPSMTPVIKAQPPGPFDRAHRLRALYNVIHDTAFEERFGVRMLCAFAITEIGVVIYTPYPDRRTGSMGRAHEDWELAIVDEADRPVPRGTAGELVVRPRRPFNMMQGYLNRPEAAVGAWRNLWYHTGDILREDDDGYYWFVDRHKDRIRRRGENVAPSEIEREVRAHPAVADCVAVGRAATGGEDDIRLVVVAKPGTALPEPADLAAWIDARLPRYMRPRFIEYAAALPLTGSDKVDRGALRDAAISPATWDRGQ